MNHLRDFAFHKVGVVNDVATNRTLYLDMDQPASPRLAPIFAICRIVGVRPMWIEYRRTQNGWHVVLVLRDRLERAEIVALQALCGSDKRRETLNLMRVLAIRRTPITDPFWQQRWNLLYSRKL